MLADEHGDMDSLCEVGVKHCRRCGARLASDHLDEEWCSPCLRANRDYDPRQDPWFLNRLLSVLAEAPGRTVEPLKALGIGYEHRQVVKDGIKALRRRGHVIRATERAAGYVYSDYCPRLPLGGVASGTASFTASLSGGLQATAPA